MYIYFLFIHDSGTVEHVQKTVDTSLDSLISRPLSLSPYFAMQGAVPVLGLR